MSEVTYAPIAEFAGYRVGNDGSVWTCRKRGFAKDLKGSWTRMVGRINPRGYHSVTLCNGGKKGFSKNVHRLVLEAFIGPCPPGMQCCHEDGNPANNNLANLRWDTPKNNTADQVRHGTKREGEGHGLAKTNEADVRKMRGMYDTGKYTCLQLAKLFGISNVAVSRIVRRKAWVHVA